MHIDVTSLTSIEIEVMAALTRARRTASAVALAADCWQPNAKAWGGDPVGLVQMIVEALGERGLLSYTLKTGPAYGYYSGLAHNIRLTPQGWDLMGYPHAIAVVGTRSSTGQFLAKKGDLTNFRKHAERAEGGAIEVDDFPTHKANYPHHVHDYDMQGDDMATAAKRPYLRVTDEIEAEVVGYAAKHPLDSHADMADVLGIGERTVSYILTDLPRIRRASNEERADASLKQRIVWALEAMDFDNVTALRKVLGRADDTHSIVHVLHSLHTEGRIDFNEKGDRKEPINIHLTRRGADQAAKQRNAMSTPSMPVITKDEEAALINGKHDDNELLPRTNGTMATVETATAGQLAAKAAYEKGLDEAAEAMAKVLELNDFPLLDTLLDREIDRKNSDHKGLRYIEAAELIRETDPETAALLDAKAAESDIPFPSPLEAEYIKYAEAHPRFAYVDADGRAQH